MCVCVCDAVNRPTWCFGRDPSGAVVEQYIKAKLYFYITLCKISIQEHGWFVVDF